MSNPNHATVQSTLGKEEAVPAALSTLDTVCSAGAQCAEVQGAPVAAQALIVLQKAVTTAHGSLTSKLQLAQALIAAMKALHVDFQAVRVAIRTYESAVDAIAAGDATVISKAGLRSRVPNPPPTALGKVAVVHSKPGKHQNEAIVTWPPGPGATGYAIQVNFTPQTPSAPYTALTSGTGRRRVVKGPTPGCQFLVQVASLGSDGTQSEWSDAILATAL